MAATQLSVFAIRVGGLRLQCWGCKDLQAVEGLGWYKLELWFFAGVLRLAGA